MQNRAPFYRLNFMGSLFLLTLLLSIGSLVHVKPAFSRVLYYGSETETVTLTYGGPTIVRFNEAVKTISQAKQFKIKPADAANPDYSVLSITPRFSRGKHKVTFILADGVVVSLLLHILPKALPEKTDTFYDLKPKAQMIERLELGADQNGVSAIELMKAMIRWDKIVGYKSQALVRKVNTGIKPLKAKLVRVYTGPRFNGYVFKIRNHSKKRAYYIDLKSLMLGKPNMAVLSQVDRKILKVKGSKRNVTFLRIVAKPSSVYYNVHLPVAPAKTDKS